MSLFPYQYQQSKHGKVLLSHSILISDTLLLHLHDGFLRFVLTEWRYCRVNDGTISRVFSGKHATQFLTKSSVSA
jgi:hypothetical protein